MNRVSAILCVLLFIALHSACNSPSEPGGSEITNGTVLSMTGNPAVGVEVTGYPQDYIAGSYPTSRRVSTLTNSDGLFTLPIDSGIYNLFIIDSTTKSGYYITDVVAEEDLGSITLAPLGSISGIVTVDRPAGAPFIIVYCIGTPLRIDIGDTDLFQFNNVPPGSYTLSIAKKMLDSTPAGIDSSIGGTAGHNNQINVSAGKATVIDTLVNVQNLGILP